MAKMIDISGKGSVKRVAIAEGCLTLKKSTLLAISANRVKKGDVITASKLAGIQAAKGTSALLPLCHQIPLTAVELEMGIKDGRLVCRCKVSAEYKTGVEMEALVGVTTALLNAWDMVKYLEKDTRGQYPGTEISGIRVTSKTKGEC
jgi:cyclic pyranopterin phosphate synthase